MTSVDPAAPYRCAVYFAPRIGSDWHRRGEAWLGRSALGDTPPDAPLPATDPTREALLAEPRRYGWHATLKAPFRLAPGRGLADLRAAIAAVAGAHRAFTLPPLVPGTDAGFLALRPAGPCEPLDAIAAACVTQLHGLAAPLDDAELARRERAGLDAQARDLLQRWGYPWVLQRFRFHLSLSGPLDGAPAGAVQALVRQAQDWFGDLPPCPFGHLSLFVEPAPGADFRLVEQLALAP